MDLLEPLTQTVRGSGRSVRAFQEQIGFSEAEWAIEPYDPFFNVNTPEDLIEAERMASGIRAP